jgi:hypothetical protein
LLAAQKIEVLAVLRSSVHCALDLVRSATVMLQERNGLFRVDVAVVFEWGYWK